MSTYMESLKQKLGYTSLKIRHAEYQVRNFPSLNGAPQSSFTMEENNEDIVPTNPIEEKDRKIFELEKALAKQESEEVSKLKENLVKATAELDEVKEKFNLSSRKLIYTRNATEQKIVESISNPDGFREDPHLISVYSATLNLDDFEEEETTDTLTQGKILS